MSMFGVIKKILISEKNFIKTNYERFKKSIRLYRKRFNRF